MAELTRIIDRVMRPLRRRVMLMIGRAVVRVVNDAELLQELQLTALAGEALDGVERIQQYGFTSVPHPGAEAVLVAVAGDRSHPLVIAVDDRRYRLAGLAGGEVALYDDQGQAVHIKRDGIVLSGHNILLHSEGVIRLDGAGVEIHGSDYVQTDINGFGSRRTHASGTAYEDDTYTTGATVDATEHGLDQPAIPSDHPDYD